MSDQTVDKDELLAELRSQVEAYERGSATAEYTPDGTVLRANERFAELVGVDPADIAGRDHRSFVSPETPSRPTTPICGRSCVPATTRPVSSGCSGRTAATCGSARPGCP